MNRSELRLDLICRILPPASELSEGSRTAARRVYRMADALTIASAGTSRWNLPGRWAIRMMYNRLDRHWPVLHPATGRTFPNSRIDTFIPGVLVCPACSLNGGREMHGLVGSVCTPLAILDEMLQDYLKKVHRG